MREEEIIMLRITRDELIDIVKEAVKQEFKRQRATGEAPKGVDADLFMTRKEVCDTLNVSSVTLNNWGKKGVLVPRKIGGRVLYEKNEVFKKLDVAA